jgi:glycosyltransferase involved in cell wall biosynthesis
MRVGVDATSWANRRGFGRFARNVVPRLVELDRETTYVFFFGGSENGSPPFPPRAERRPVPLERTSAEGPGAGAGRHPLDLLRLARAVSRSNLDAFLFPSVYSYFPVLRVPTVIGLHDTTAERHPELLFATRKDRLFWRAKQGLALRLADRFFAVSVAARDAVAADLGLDPARIPVVGEAPDPVFSPRARDEVEAALEAVGLGPDEPYLMYAAGLSPHKNVETLLAAVARANAAVRLVLAGDLDGDPYLSAAGSIRERIAALGLGKRVMLPGYVPDDQLAALYTGAAAAVVPSLSEGFGLPAVEAAACRAPVVLSELPAHRETLGDAALFFPPRDVGALTERIERLVADADLRRSLGAAARDAAARLSWDASAERLREVIADAVRGSPDA